MTAVVMPWMISETGHIIQHTDENVHGPQSLHWHHWKNKRLCWVRSRSGYPNILYLTKRNSKLIWGNIKMNQNNMKLLSITLWILHILGSDMLWIVCFFYTSTSWRIQGPFLISTWTYTAQLWSSPFFLIFLESVSFWLCLIVFQ